MTAQFNEQYQTNVNVAATGEFEVAFSGTKDGVTVSSNVTGNLNEVAAPAAVTAARDTFAGLEAEAAKVLEG